MSDLLIILVALGVLIVLGVLVFNWLQEKKYRSRIAQDFKPSTRDVLIDDFKSVKPKTTAEKIEPTMQDSAAEIKPLSQPQTAPAAYSPPERKPVTEPVAPKAMPFEMTDASTPASQPLDNATVTDALSAEALNTNTLSTNELSLEEPEAAIVTEEAVAQVATDDAIPHQVHSQIDLVGVLYPSEPISADQVTPFTSFEDVAQHHFAFGLNQQEDWVELKAAKVTDSFTQLLYSLQLADRGGPITRDALNHFQHEVEAAGMELGAQVEWQGKGDPLNNAVTLDTFCIEVDKTVGFHVFAGANASFHGTKLRGLVESQGLKLTDDGRFVMLQSDAQAEDFYLKNYEGNDFSADMLKNTVMHGITFQLDIPTVINSSEVFDSMIACAKTMASSLEAQIVDDKRKEIGDLQLEKIRQQLNVINSQMIAKGIIPGSSHALRLFS